MKSSKYSQISFISGGSSIPTKLYQPDETNPFVYTDNDGILHIDGDIIQNGDTYETHAEKIYTTKDLIISREGAIDAISVGDISGLQVTKYDGTNNLLFGTDAGGYFKVGEPGELQILSTREDAPNDTSIAVWNDAEKRFNTSSNLIWDGTDLKISSNAVATETWVSNNFNNYSHPTHPGDNAAIDTGVLSGTTVISDLDLNVTTDTNGHVTDANATVSTRNLSKSDFSLDTDDNVRFSSFGVGTTATGTTGEIIATDDITAFYSDERLKSFQGTIDLATDKLDQISGYYFQPNELAESFGYTDKVKQVGVNAQEIQKVLPEAVRLAPFDRGSNGESKSGENYLTVKYEKIVPLLIQIAKEQREEIKELKAALSKLL